MQMAAAMLVSDTAGSVAVVDQPCVCMSGALLVESELQLLPREVAYSRVNGVWNLSSEAGNMGTFYITNCRVVWFSTASNAFNVSIPYLQVSHSSGMRSADAISCGILETVACMPHRLTEAAGMHQSVGQGCCRVPSVHVGNHNI